MWVCLIVLKDSCASSLRCVFDDQVIGKWGKVVVDYSLLASQMGFCVAYIIFIAANLSDVIKHETGSDYVSQRVLAICRFG